MDENIKKPSLRFKGFTDDWEQRELGKIGSTYTGLSGKNSNDFGHGKGKYVTYLNVFGNPISNPEMVENVEIDKSQNKVVNGDVFFTTSSETPEEVGMSSIWLSNEENTYLNSFCFGYRPSIEIDPHYLGYMLRSPGFRSKMVILAQGISRYNISKSKAMQLSISLPTLQEQIKVGKMLDTISNLITLHQRKYETLLNVKKSLLQKMFPKENFDIPEIRFKGFTDAWEQYKFNQIMDTVTDFVAAGSFADMAENVVYESLPDYAQLVRTTDLKSNFSNHNFVYVNKKAFDFLWRVNLDTESIIMPNIGNCGEIYYVNQEILPYKHNVLGPNAILVRSENQNNKFLSVSFLSDDFQRKLKLIVSPNGQTKFNKTELKTLDVIIPSVKEQIKVGTLFDSLDSLITLHQRKYEILLNYKKALLQKMFI
jgi:type I restriction enzyme S subunit